MKVTTACPQDYSVLQQCAERSYRSSSSLELEHANPTDVLNYLEDDVWKDSPFQNPQLRLKIRKVAHDQTIEVLTLLKKKVDLASTIYKTIYLDIFQVLIAR